MGTAYLVSISSESDYLEDEDPFNMFDSNPTQPIADKDGSDVEFVPGPIDYASIDDMLKLSGEIGKGPTAREYTDREHKTLTNKTPKHNPQTQTHKPYFVILHLCFLFCFLWFLILFSKEAFPRKSKKGKAKGKKGKAKGKKGGKKLVKDTASVRKFRVSSKKASIALTSRGKKPMSASLAASPSVGSSFSPSVSPIDIIFAKKEKQKARHRLYSRAYHSEEARCIKLKMGKVATTTRARMAATAAVKEWSASHV